MEKPIVQSLLDRCVNILNAPFLGTLIEIVLILAMFGIAMLTLFGTGIAKNIPDFTDRPVFYVGLGVWGGLCLTGSCMYFTRIVQKRPSVWLARLIHLAYWAWHWLAFLVLVATNNKIALDLAPWIDLITLPGLLIIACFVFFINWFCVKVKQDYKNLNLDA